MDLSLLCHSLPEELLLHFDIVSIKELGDTASKKDCLYIYLDEKNTVPNQYRSDEYESKGFYERKLIQDLPIRGKAVYLGICRRRWRNKEDKSIEIKSDFSFIAEGSKLTVELSDFLKDTGRDPEDTISNIASYYGIKPDLLRRHYKKKVSGFDLWNQFDHAENYLIYPENIGQNLSIDELSLSKGELYTFVTNKLGRGKKKTLVAIIKGTKSQDIIDVIEKIPLAKRKTVKEVTLDMANNMQLAAKMCFPEAYLVSDRFHVVKLVLEALQHLRVTYRWKEIEKENAAIKKAKEENIKYSPLTFDNDDTPKQLLARSRYIIAKKSNEWTQSQKQRAEILFKHFPELHQAYNYTLEFRNIYELQSKSLAKEKILDWINNAKLLKMTIFNTAANSLRYHLETITNFFINRHTNANAESFNSKIKLFRANQRGVVDTKFFLFRMEKLFA